MAELYFQFLKKLGDKKVKKALCFFVVLFSSCLLITATSARAIELNEAVKESSLFFAGYTMGFINHELGHQLMASAKGIDMQWDVQRNFFHSTWRANKKDQSVSLAGFGAQILSTEAILNSGINKKNSFIFGLLFFNIQNSLAYVVQNELDSSHRKGDFVDIKEKRAVEAILVSHALFTAYRMHKNKDFPVWIEIGANEFVIGIKKRFFA